MAAAFDTLQRASFADLPFPVREIEVIGGLRDHVHEYPHSPGGAPEKLGRKLYEFHFVAPFLNTFKAYPDLWPDTLAALRLVFESGQTDDLVVPTIGTIKAYCISWRERTDLPSNRSGVIVDLTFREDQADLFLIESLITVYAANLGGTSAALLAAMQADLAFQAALSPSQVGLFQSIQNVANSITAVADQANAYANIVQAKAQAVTSLCAVADATVLPLNNPAHFRVLEAMMGVWAQAGRLERDALRLARPLIPYTTPVAMSVSQIATAIYGDTGQAAKLLQINSWENPFRVPAGTSIKAYALAAAGA